MGALDGKVALITGGTRGIGRAIAEGFLAEGASVMVNGRSRDKGDAALQEMGAGDRAGFVAGDVKVEDDCGAMVDATVDRFGTIDILVNNAGGASIHAPVHEATTELLDDALVWNLHSTVWCTRRALPHMYGKNWGRVINISSIEGKTAKPGIVGYVVAKHAVNGFTKTAAIEGAAAGVTVNAICPGAIETDIMQESGPDAAAAAGITYEELLDSFAQASLMKRLNTEEEVAAMATLLASPAGGGITGQCINVDCGTIITG